MPPSFLTDAAVCLHFTVVLLHRLSTSGEWWQAARAKHPLMLTQVLWEFSNVSDSLENLLTGKIHVYLIEALVYQKQYDVHTGHPAWGSNENV
jgi:hypothetical protein